MNRSSLNIRLSTAAAISILCALTLSGFFLMFLFERHVVRRVDQELSVYIKQLAAGLEVAIDGTPSLAISLADPRFGRPLSGLYWQIETESGRIVLRSRSLWDQSLSLSKIDPKVHSPHRQEIEGPDGETLIVRTRIIFLETAQGDHAFRLAAAINKNEVVAARTDFSRDLLVALGLLAVALLVAAWLQVFFGLRPMKQIRERINDIRTGSTQRLEGHFPAEVQLLVDEVNALLSANEEAIERARDSAADLAHGLKTPLAILRAEARTLAEHQQTDSADEIAAQVEQMRVRIERHLAVVRMRGPASGAIARTDARKGFEKIVKAMSVMPRGEDIAWRIDVASDLKLALDNQDFFEVFGNILDNARKWAASAVEIVGEDRGDAIVLNIRDDGPGVPDEKIAKILERGGHLDENKTGAGLGLAIARKILEAYGAELGVENRAEGGVQISVSIPKPSLDA